MTRALEVSPDKKDVIVSNFSSGLLTILEKFGMQPPNVTLDQLIPGDLKTAPEAEKHFYACWEPEDNPCPYHPTNNACDYCGAFDEKI